MILASQSISSQNENFNDYRYQKALKQISKLINVNRDIKIQSEKFKSQIKEMNERFEELQQINHKLQNEIQTLKSQIRNLNTSYTELQNFCKSVEFEQKQLITSKQMEVCTKVQMQHQHQQEVQSLQNRFKEQINEIMLQLHQKDLKIHQLEQKSYYANQLQLQNNKLQQQIQRIAQENRQWKGKIQQRNQQLINISSKVKQQPNQDLISKLKINQEWIKSLNQQNYVLKQKCLQDQYKKEKQKCNESIFQANTKDIKSILNLSTGNLNQIMVKEYIKQYQKRIKKLEDQRQKIYNKYTKLKYKTSQIQNMKFQHEKQINILKIKISGYQQLTQRQQKQIENMIEEFHREMQKANKEIQKALKNKNKTINSLNSVSIMESPKKETEIQKQKCLSSRMQSLQEQILLNKNQAHEKDKLLNVLQIKIQAFQQQNKGLRQENDQIKQINMELQRQLDLVRNSDLSKTFKISSKGDVIMKTQPNIKNGSKVFLINGKKYESKLLKHEQVNNQQKNLDQMKMSIESNMRKLERVESREIPTVIVHPTNQIQYFSSNRNYQNSNAPHYISRA